MKVITDVTHPIMRTMATVADSMINVSFQDLMNPTTIAEQNMELPETKRPTFWPTPS
jgi:O-phosphoseryl-tRNA(Cys) synthetase